MIAKDQKREGGAARKKHNPISGRSIVEMYSLFYLPLFSLT